MTDTPPMWLCVHESGHCAAHTVLAPGGVILSASVDKTVCAPHIGLVRIRRNSHVGPCDYATTCLAGFVAELFWWHGVGRPALPPFAGQRDLHDAMEAIAATGTIDIHAELVRLWERACDLIATCWPRVVELAGVLQARKTLSGDEVARIFAREGCAACPH